MEMALDNEEPVPFVFRKLEEFEGIEDHDWQATCKEVIEIKPENDSVGIQASSSCSANVGLGMSGAACVTDTRQSQESKSVIVMPMPSTASETTAEAAQENYYLVMRQTGENEIKVAVVPAAVGNTNGDVDLTNNATCTRLENQPNIVCNSQVNSLDSTFPNQEVVLQTEMDSVKVENGHTNGDVVRVIHMNSVGGRLENHSVVPDLTVASHSTNGRSTINVHSSDKDDCKQGPFKVRVTVNRSWKRTSLYKCTACGTSFGGICALAGLSDTFHVTKCDECDQVFTDEYSSMEHKRRVHGVQLYCENCEKKYAGQGSIATPRIDQRPSHEAPATSQLYACEICGREMKNLFYLNRHRTRHNVKYTCTCCGHQFQNRQSFRLHMNLMKVQSGRTANPLPEETIPTTVLENDAEQRRQSDLKKTCRVCGKVQKNCRPITSKRLPIILRCYGVDITKEDGNVYPKVICARCEINLLRPRKSFIRKCADVAEPDLPTELAKFGAEEKSEKSCPEKSLSTASMELESTAVKHDDSDGLYDEQSDHSSHINSTWSYSLSHS